MDKNLRIKICLPHFGEILSDCVWPIRIRSWETCMRFPISRNLLCFMHRPILPVSSRITSLTPEESGTWFNIKMSSYQYRKSHCGDKTVVRSSYLHNGISYTDKMSSLYWIGALIISRRPKICTYHGPSGLLYLYHIMFFTLIPYTEWNVAPWLADIDSIIIT